tara:strand:+ start:454 stop:1623 length:1170 start_codon:yes stop_codon:yes gene_type:complete
MFSKNINFKNFKKINNISQNKKINDLLKKELTNNSLLLNSLSSEYKYSFKKKDIKKLKNFKFYNLIGMGGSTLGVEAIYDFLNHKIKKKFKFYNNLPSQNILKSSNKKVNLIISKSGNTLETISNFNLILKKQKKNKNVIITENRNNFLNLLAKKLKADVFEHKNYIGGRYSVLSEVGMLPAQLMGLNERKFKRFNYLVKNRLFINSLVRNVGFIYNCISKGKKNSVILNYDEKSENFFKWYQQLSAESLGKKSKGIFPIISSMPKDNHSLLQLYLDGPKDNFFTFFNTTSDKSQKLENKNLFNKFKILKNKKISEIVSSQKKATENIFRLKNIPFRSFELLNRSEENLGELFCFFILETILLGRLLKVNPFDQPSVELIKAETRKLLL